MKPSEVLIVNPMAKTTAWVRSDLDGKRKDFKSWYEFLSWFDEKYHGEFILPPNSQEKFIDVLVDTLADSPRKRRTEARLKAAASPKKEKAATTNSFGSGSIAVEVAGVRYGTLATAFKKLGLPMADRKTVRKEIIAKKTFDYGGHTFKLLEE